MCAPRPLFISVGSPTVEGQWIDARGMFLAGVGAGPVYKLLGKKDLGTSEFPKLETALVDGEIAFRQHREGHTTGPNWPTFFDVCGTVLWKDNVEVELALPSGKDRFDFLPSSLATTSPRTKVIEAVSAGRVA